MKSGLKLSVRGVVKHGVFSSHDGISQYVFGFTFLFLHVEQTKGRIEDAPPIFSRAFTDGDIERFVISRRKSERTIGFFRYPANAQLRIHLIIPSLILYDLLCFLTDFSEAYARGLLLGIARYAHDTGQAWSLCRLPLSIRDKCGIEAVIDWALRMRADAVIGQFYNTDNVELFARNGIIAVAQDFKARFTTIPNITGPHYRAGQMGAEYFLKKGFRHFAFYGTRGIVWSDERYQGFRETVRRANPEFTFSALRNTSQTDLWLYDPIQLTTWLQSLPKPVAIMACDDNQAYHITEACLQAEGGGGGEIPHPGRHCRTRRRQRRDDLPAVGPESLVA